MLGTGEKHLTFSEQALIEQWNHQKIIPQYNLFSNALSDIKNHCNNVYDFRGAFDKINMDLYFDGAHVGYQGNNIIAKKLFEISKTFVN